jgi:hypothetical protein
MGIERSNKTMDDWHDEREAKIKALREIKTIIYQDYGLGCDALLDKLDALEVKYGQS